MEVETVRTYLDGIKYRVTSFMASYGAGIAVLALLVGSWCGYFINDQAKPARPEAQWVAPSEKMPELDKTIFGLYRITITEDGEHRIVHPGSPDIVMGTEAFNIKCTEVNWGNGKIDTWWVFDDGEDFSKANQGPPLRWSELPIFPDGLMK